MELVKYIEIVFGDKIKKLKGQKKLFFQKKITFCCPNRAKQLEASLVRIIIDIVCIIKILRSIVVNVMISCGLCNGFCMLM